MGRSEFNRGVNTSGFILSLHLQISALACFITDDYFWLHLPLVCGGIWITVTFLFETLDQVVLLALLFAFLFSFSGEGLFLCLAAPRSLGAT